MTIDIPPHDFEAARNPMADELIVTPELQSWASKAADALAAAGHHIPADLHLVRDGFSVPRSRWVWLVDEVQKPRRGDCPF